MKFRLAITLICLLSNFSYSQSLKCTEFNKLNERINTLYDFFIYTLEDEKLDLNDESYYLIFFGDGETDYSFSSLIVPSVNNTIVYQYSPIEYIVKESYDINLDKNSILKHLNHISAKPKDYVPSLYYVIISTNPDKADKCEHVIGSLKSLPSKKEYLVDFDKVIENLK